MGCTGGVLGPSAADDEIIDPSRAADQVPDRAAASARPARAGGPSLLTLPYSLGVSCSLAEDYLLVDPQVASSASDRVAPFVASDGSTQAVIMITENGVGTLFWLRGDAGQPGGWSSDAISDTAGVIDFVVTNNAGSNEAGQQGGAIELFCRTAAGVQVFQLIHDPVDQTWSWQASGETLSWQTPLQTSYLENDFLVSLVYSYDATSRQIPYRISSYGRVETGTLQVDVVSMPPPTSVGVVPVWRLSSGGPDLEGFAVQLVTTFFVGYAEVQLSSWGADATISGSVATTVGPTTARFAMVAMAESFGAAYSVVEDTVTGDLYTVASQPGYRPTKVWDHSLYGPADSVSALQVFPTASLGGQQDSLLDLLVVSDGNLALQHQLLQQGSASNPLNGTNPLFVPPIPLGSGIATAGAALTPNQTDARTVATVDTHGAVTMLTQQTSTGPWASQRVLLSGQKPEQVDTYRVQLSVADVNGVPAGGVQLSVTAASTVLAISDGTADLLGAAATTMTTDSYGRVVFAVPADGLSTPTLTVSGDASTGLKPTTVNPAADIQAFLAGTASLHYADYQLDAGTLRRATAGPTGPVLAPQLDDATATTAVTVLATAFGTATGAAPGGGASRDHAVSLGRSDGPLLTSLRVGNLETSLDHFAGDLWHAVKTGAATVAQIIVDTAGAISGIAVTLAGWGQQLLAAAVQTVDDAVNVAHAVFNQIAAGVAKAVAWLREDVLELLADTVALADDLYGWLSTAPGYIKTAAATYTDTVNSVLADPGSTFITEIRTSLTSSDVPTSTLGQLSRPAELTGRHVGAAPTATVSVDPHQFSSNNHANWLFTKIQAEFSGGPPQDPALADATTNLFAKLEDVTQSCVDNMKRLWTNVGAPGTADAGKSITMAALAAALATVIDAFAAIAKVIADTVLEFIALVAGEVQQHVIDATLSELPLIGPLLATTQLGQLTFGKLVCLIVAFPAALVYRQHSPAGASLVARVSARRGGKLGDGIPLLTEITWLSVAAAGLWAFFDTCIDVAGSNDLTAIIDIVMPLIILACTFPIADVPFAKPTRTGTAADLSFAAWAVGFLPPLGSVATFYGTNPKVKKILRRTYYGPLIITVTGVISTALGVGANIASHDADAGEWAATVLGGLVVLGGFLGFDEVIAETDGLSMVAKVVVDLFAGLGAAAGTGFS